MALNAFQIARSCARKARAMKSGILKRITPEKNIAVGASLQPLTAPLMLRAQSRPWPSANCHRLNPARHVASSVALSNSGNFTKGQT
jgi:hypothetical protein